VVQGRGCEQMNGPLQGANRVRLQALGALAGLALHALVLVQSAVARSLDGGKVNEHVWATPVDGDEAKAFFCVEPLDDALWHVLSLDLHWNLMLRPALAPAATVARTTRPMGGVPREA